MASRTQLTGFSRFLIVAILMVALFFGVRYALEQTSWGQELHHDLQEAAE